MQRFVWLLFILAAGVSAEDWPEWRGKGRLGVWNEAGVIEKFPDTGLRVEWRVPVHSGFSGPAVSNGRIYLTDFSPASRLKGRERVLCLEEKTGKVLWTREWDADYTGLMEIYATGPRATPTVDGDRVYVVGAKGFLQCLDAHTGAVRWQKDYVKDYNAEIPTWGVTSAPLVDGGRLICLVGGARNAKVVAFDKLTGKEIWRALPSDSEPGYCQPVIVTSGATRQLIVWHPLAVTSLDPETGKVYWEQPFKIEAGLSVATPVWSAPLLLVSSFYNGSMMLTLNERKPGAEILWRGKSKSEIDTDGLHALVTTPVIAGDYIYGICSYGQLRCLNARTGARVWESLELTKEKTRWASGFLVRHGDRFFINNDHGELIIAQLSPDGYHEISRTKLIQPTSNSGNRRELGAVNWSHPAYANRHIVARNDTEVIRASLAAN
ncbi:MAG TPA: PQQ-binding-like beta-propeller repeat protein [Bryobacteraceae bacterium]|nr:PQQ-binding-like beta-propeller repeat protein [Bryobacteraceae bacterium]